jgi:hypothetical protein
MFRAFGLSGFRTSGLSVFKTLRDVVLNHTIMRFTSPTSRPYSVFAPLYREMASEVGVRKSCSGLTDFRCSVLSPIISLVKSVKALRKSGFTFAPPHRMFPVSRAFFWTNGDPLSPSRPRPGPKPAVPDFSWLRSNFSA